MYMFSNTHTNKRLNTYQGVKNYNSGKLCSLHHLFTQFFFRYTYISSVKVLISFFFSHIKKFISNVLFFVDMNSIFSLSLYVGSFFHIYNVLCSSVFRSFLLVNRFTFFIQYKVYNFLFLYKFVYGIVYKTYLSKRKCMFSVS